MTDYRLCPAGDLRRFVQGVCRALDAPEEVAAEVAHHLVRSNLSGHDSHGVLRLPWYVEQVEGGRLLPAARPAILRERGASALLDAGWTFGQYSTIVALEGAMARAREHGIGIVAIRHSNHIGRLGEYSERAAAQGMVAIVTYGATGRNAGIVTPFGGRERFLGTNPWSIGVPVAEGTPLVFDAATSTIAEGKLRVARSKGVPAPEGTIIDADGMATTNPEDFYSGGALLPLGGAGGGHKGYGLAMASAMIGALAMIDDDVTIPPSSAALSPQTDNRGRVGGVAVIAIDPTAFGPGDRYAALTGEALAAAKRVAPAPNVAEVLTPGEPEARSRAARERDGIPLPEPIWTELSAVADRYSVAMPEQRAG